MIETGTYRWVKCVDGGFPEIARKANRGWLYPGVEHPLPARWIGAGDGLSNIPHDWEGPFDAEPPPDE